MAKLLSKKLFSIVKTNRRGERKRGRARLFKIYRGFYTRSCVVCSLKCRFHSQTERERERERKEEVDRACTSSSRDDASYACGALSLSSLPRRL